MSQSSLKFARIGITQARADLSTKISDPRYTYYFNGLYTYNTDVAGHGFWLGGEANVFDT